MSNRLPLAILLVASALAVAAPGASAEHPVTAAHAAGATCADARLVPGPGRLARMRAATICLINVERTKRGLHALRRSDHLTAVASAHSLDMVKHKYFGHNTAYRPNPVARLSSAPLAHAAWRSGENIAWGTLSRGTPKAIVALWMGSAGHRANILNPSFRDIGVGIALGNPVHGTAGGATYTTNFYGKY